MKLTIKDIRDLNPCYDPIKYATEDWQGTPQEILRSSKVPPQDRLWVVCRKEFVSEDILYKFAENCAWQVVYTIPENEQLEHCNILSIIRLARETNDSDLMNAAMNVVIETARNTAIEAARNASWYAAWDAAMKNAVWNASWHATRDAIRDEFCLMLADMIDGTFDGEFYLIDRLVSEGFKPEIYKE